MRCPGRTSAEDRRALQALKVTDFLRELLMGGGLVEYYKGHKAFPWEEL